MNKQAILNFEESYFWSVYERLRTSIVHRAIVHLPRYSTEYSVQYPSCMVRYHTSWSYSYIVHYLSWREEGNRESIKPHLSSISNNTIHHTMERFQSWVALTVLSLVVVGAIFDEVPNGRNGKTDFALATAFTSLILGGIFTVANLVDSLRNRLVGNVIENGESSSSLL